jgi:hypothetical protein
LDAPDHDLRDLLRTLSPAAREHLRNVLICDHADRVGVHRRSVERVLGTGVTVPHATTRARYLEAARGWCGEQLLVNEWRVGRDPTGTIWCYREHASAVKLRTCLVCGRPVEHQLATYCGTTCKKRAYRLRRKSGLSGG